MTSVRALAGAVVVGFGSVFGHRRAEQHWAERPRVELEDEEAGAPSGDDLGDPALVVLERRLAAVEHALDRSSGGASLCDLSRSGAAGQVKELEGRVAALLDARRELRRGPDARLAVGMAVASWERSVQVAQQQGPQWLAYRWGGAEELRALADDLARLDVAAPDGA